MSSNPTDFALSAWKCQLDTVMKVAEAIVEGAEKAREIQLAAGVDAHAWLEANRKALAGVTSPQELLVLQSRLLTQDLAKVTQYWSRLGANARDTQGRVVQAFIDGSTLAAAPQLPAEALTSALDASFKQWLESLKWLSRAGSPTTTAPTPT
jgi:hypothetical protein